MTSPRRWTPLVLAVLLAALGACKKLGPAGSGDSPAQHPNAVSVTIAYGSEKKAWLEEQITAFNQKGPRLGSGAPLVIRGMAMGSGEAVQDILDGRLEPAVFSPASGAYLSLLNQAWLARAGNTRPLAPGGDSVVISPLVIAMWRPMAEALGWPGKALGWADIIKIGRDPAGWGGKATARPEWGRFKLGHTHPEYSTSGLLAVLAEAYAGADKTRGLDASDLQAKKTRDFVTGVEASIVHYGKSTGFFADKMVARGPGYLSAAVLYENLVIESYGKAGAMPLVAIYPREGTFWSDHPYAVLDAPWVTAPLREGAEAFLAFLKARPAQERALALGFRPADPSVPMGAPVDAAHGVDPRQPQTLLEVPQAATMGKLLDLWRETKKTSDVTLVFDKSGSMEGQPLAQAKEGALAFLRDLQPRDSVSLLFFDGQVYPVVGPTVGPGKAVLSSRIQQTIAGGGTALYDAVLAAYESIDARARKEPGRIHALVVMTDGKDEHSRSTLEMVKQKLASEGEAPVKVFTIAYGKGAQGDALSAIAEAGRGSQSKGSVENIVQVYRDIASFF